MTKICIKCTTEENIAWCGKELDGTFNFKDTEAAVINNKFDNSMKICNACVRVVTDHLLEIGRGTFRYWVEDTYVGEEEKQLTFADCIIGIKKPVGDNNVK